jgi:hypothetical protein
LIVAICKLLAQQLTAAFLLGFGSELSEPAPKSSKVEQLGYHNESRQKGYANKMSLIQTFASNQRHCVVVFFEN